MTQNQRIITLLQIATYSLHKMRSALEVVNPISKFTLFCSFTLERMKVILPAQFWARFRTNGKSENIKIYRPAAMLLGCINDKITLL